jgi:dGTPase
MSALTDDVRVETGNRLRHAKPGSATAIRHHPGALAGFSDAMLGEVQALKRFLYERMYRHPRVMGPMEEAKKIVTGLFKALMANPALLPPDWLDQCGQSGDSSTRRVVRDYIAGMTDNYALAEYHRILEK